MKNISPKTVTLTQLALFSALIILLTFTPLGYIPVGSLSATIIHIPVIIGAIVLGTKYGAVLGGIMGIFSLIRAAVMPATPLDVLFLNPLVSVFPRILIGLAASSIFIWLQKSFMNKKFSTPIAIGISAAVATIVNTVTVLGLLALLYSDQLQLDGTSVLSFVFGSVIAVNGIIEIVSAVALSIPIGMALLKLKRNLLQ